MPGWWPVQAQQPYQAGLRSPGVCLTSADYSEVRYLLPRTKRAPENRNCTSFFLPYSSGSPSVSFYSPEEKFNVPFSPILTKTLWGNLVMSTNIHSLQSSILTFSGSILWKQMLMCTPGMYKNVHCRMTPNDTGRPQMTRQRLRKLGYLNIMGTVQS